MSGRRAFEAHYIETYGPKVWLARNDDGTYENAEVQRSYADFLAGAASVVKVPELRNIRDVRPFSEFVALVEFPSCRAAGAFVRDLGAAIRGRK